MRAGNGQFAQGHSGNPGGRPRGSGITQRLRMLLDEPDPDAPDQSKGDKLANVIWKRACAGDMRAASLLLDRVEGKPRAVADEEAEENNLPKCLNEILRAGQRAANGSQS